MEITGRIALVQPLASDMTTNGETKNGFSDLFGQLLGKSLDDTAEIVHKTDGLTKEEITELINFLQQETPFELEEGLQFLTGIDLREEEQVIKGFAEEMNMNVADVKQSIFHLFEAMQSMIATETEESNNIPDQIKLLDEQISLEDVSLSQVIQMITALNADEAFSPTEQTKAAIQLFKLFELMNANQQSQFVDGQKLKDFLQKIGEKLVKMGEDQTDAVLDKPFNKMEFLQKTFAPVAVNFNQNSERSNIVVSEVNGKADLITPPGVIPLQQMSKVEQLTIMLNPNGKLVSTEQLIQQFENILSRSQFSKNGQTQRLLIRLAPEHLGSLRVEIVQKDSMIIARILTSSAMAKDILDTNINGLRQAFVGQNLQVERIEVAQQMHSQQDKPLSKEQQNQQEQGHHPDEQNKENNQERNSFLQNFEEELLNIEI
ncbi:flagellar hook-length control protein FliK [Cytobacillus purgationiresistens]|uniref:Flagellar hook-length control protein FliK n=1 Tax=Cytobacillus purgationiresistens TaxID=863449 RepID=A0ABU0AG40_9BACI|nr:flagellar hook-length control protein FliK [Cytobacillus purgationiresistens]MDQ0270226.1 flagellar hook-length control protein FliK [Cytobacillus purgationiresistens]